MNALSAYSTRLRPRARAAQALAALLATAWLWPAGTQAATQYTYDELNRLTQVIYDDGRRINYTYDAAGNLLNETRSAPQQVPNLLAWWTFDDCTAADQSGRGNHGTVGAGVVCEAGRVGNAMRFSGGTITVPASDSLRVDVQVTLSAVVRLDAGSGQAAGILQKGLSNQVWDYGLVTYSHTPAYRSNATDWVGNAGNALPDYAGAYHLFTTVINEDDLEQPIRIYVDGVQLPGEVRSIGGEDPRGSYRTVLITPSSVGLTMGIGHPGKSLLGALDDVRIYDKALTPQQVADLARSLGFMP